MKKILHLLFNIDHFLIALTSLLFTAVLFYLFSFNIGFLNPVRRAFADFSMSDVYYNIIWQGNEPLQSDQITLVNIDTLYQRRDIAKVIEEIDSYLPSVVGIDILFDGNKSDQQGDSILSEAMQKNFENKVISYKLMDYNSKAGSFDRSLHSYFLEDTPFIQEGYTNVLYSEARTTLRMLTVFRKENGEPTYSFPAQIYNKFKNNYEEIDTTTLNDRLINFPTVKFPIVHFDSLAQHPELLKDRIVLLGSTTEEADMHYTPIGYISGLEVQAYALNSLIDQQNIHIMDNLTVWILAFVASYVTELLQFFILRWLNRRRGPLAMFLYGSVAFIRLVTFSWLGVIAYLAFITYITQNIFVSTTAILVAAILTSEARGVYSSFLRHVLNKHNIPLFKNSLYINK